MSREARRAEHDGARPAKRKTHKAGSILEYAGLARVTERIIRGLSARRPRRCLATLGGTTTLADCVVALRYLSDPRKLIRGPAVASYEQAFAQQVGVRYAYSFSAGRVGLYCLLRAMRIGAGDEVLLQVPTHMVVANAVRYAGARPVYADCRLDTYGMDLDEAERLVTPRTKALIIQHTFGIPTDLDAALDLASRYDLEVIEDCVHGLGAKYDGRQVGSFGRAAFFSTEETKTISTTMGGMAVTDDAELAGSIEAFQASCSWPASSTTARYLLELVLYHLLTEPHLHRYVREIYELVGERNPLPGPTTTDEACGLKPPNYERRLSNAQAALGLRQLRSLEANIAHRRMVADRYTSYFSELGIRTYEAPAKAQPALVRYPVRVRNRAATLRAVAPHAALGTWFTSVLQESLAPSYGGYVEGSCPRAESAARQLVNLPTNPRVAEPDIEAITSALAGVMSLRGVEESAPTSRGQAASG
jgi:perosamine synthetase